MTLRRAVLIHLKNYWAWVTFLKKVKIRKMTFSRHKIPFIYRTSSRIKLADLFSPTASFEIVRILFAIIVQFNMHAIQLDVKAAFLYGNLKEPVYIEQPQGFEDGTDRVCLLHKSLYGLRQASKCWYIRFHEFLLKFKFASCKSEPCLYYSFGNGATTFVLIHVGRRFNYY